MYNPKSFENCDKWRDAVEEYGRKDVVVMLVGCKIDKAGYNYNRKTVEMLSGLIKQGKWKKFDASYCECSAKTGDNVKNVFITVAEKVMMKRRGKSESDRLSNTIATITVISAATRVAPAAL